MNALIWSSRVRSVGKVGISREKSSTNEGGIFEPRDTRGIKLLATSGICIHGQGSSLPGDSGSWEIAHISLVIVLVSEQWNPVSVVCIRHARDVCIIIVVYCNFSQFRKVENVERGFQGCSVGVWVGTGVLRWNRPRRCYHGTIFIRNVFMICWVS